MIGVDADRLGHRQEQRTQAAPIRLDRDNVRNEVSSRDIRLHPVEQSSVLSNHARVERRSVSSRSSRGRISATIRETVLTEARILPPWQSHQLRAVRTSSRDPGARSAGGAVGCQLFHWLGAG